MIIIKTIIKKLIKFTAFAVIISILATGFSACGSKRKPSAENIKVGDTFSFGAYEQDNDKSNGAEDIEWLVLAKENDRILLISKYALDCRAFCDDDTGTSWKDSFLRNWLNTEFMQNAFNDTEKSNIMTTEIRSEENNEEITKDKVFVPDNSEAGKYFKDDISRRCSPTDYAKQRGVKCPEDLQDVKFDEDVKGTCCYWLRSPGFHGDKVSIVDYEGTIYERGEFIDEEIAVRPVLWLNVGNL